MTRIVFMGSPAFAVPALERLADSYEVVAVVTQPDRPAGRKRRLTAPPVKAAALARGLPVWQPPTLRTPQAVARLRALAPDLVVVVAFGQILRANVLEIPPHGCLNLHGSLLPKYRGAAPVPATILSAETETGVTLMRMDEGMDTGPVIAQATCPIAPDDTTATLRDKLCHLGADLLIETLPRWLAGEVTLQPQDDSQATYCHPIAKSDGRLDWQLSAEELARRVRAFIGRRRSPPGRGNHSRCCAPSLCPTGAARDSPARWSPSTTASAWSQEGVHCVWKRCSLPASAP
jgi:methionyl-tRNA formyltransferase